jgi:flavodoxin
VKYLVVYFSLTGNSRKVADAVFQALPGDKTIQPLDETVNLDGIDLTFICFPVMQFGPPAIVRKFMAEQAAGKRVALFITHAMFSESFDLQHNAMLKKELEKCRSACSHSQLAGLFHCQGELSEKVARELMATKIPMLMDFAGMRPLTLGHPDLADLEKAKTFAISLI